MPATTTTESTSKAKSPKIKLATKRARKQEKNINGKIVTQ